MYRQQLVPMRSRLFMPQPRSMFRNKRWRWIGLALITLCLSLVTKTFSTSADQTSPLAVSAAMSKHSDWVEAVIAQGMRQQVSPFAHSTDSDWVKAVIAQGTKQTPAL